MFSLKNKNEDFVYARLKIQLFKYITQTYRKQTISALGKEIIIIVLTYAHILTMVAMMKILSVILIR
jgi:hypothetical protein